MTGERLLKKQAAELANLRRVLINSLIVFISASLTLIACEVLTSEFLLSEERLASMIDERSILLKENLVGVRTEYVPSRIQPGANLEMKPYSFVTDSNGYLIARSAEVNTSSASEIDIIFFGGSTTECRYVDEEKRFPIMLQRLLTKSGGEPVTTLNAGVSGNHSLHSTFSLLSKGLEIRPSYVVLKHASNDMSLLTRTGSYYKAPRSRSIVQTADKGDGRVVGFLRSLKNLLIPNLWALYRKHYSNPFRGILKREWDGYPISREVNREEIRQLFEESLSTFVRVATIHGVTPVLMTQANRFREDDDVIRDHWEMLQEPLSYDDMIEIYASFNSTVRKVAADEGILLID